MKIGFNSITDSNEIRGPVRYSLEIIRELSHLEPQDRIIVFISPWLERKYREWFKDCQNVDICVIKNVPRRRIFRNVWQLIIMPFVMNKFDLDIYHIMDTSPYIFNLNRHTKVLATIHDIAEYRVPHRFSRLQSLARRIISRLEARRVDHVVTVSEFSKNELQKVFKIASNKISVIYNGVSKFQFSHSHSAAPRGVADLFPHISNDYLMTVGVIEGGKNIDLCVKAFAKVSTQNRNPELNLVIIGKKGNAYPIVNTLAHELGIVKKVHFLDYVDDDILRIFYKGATAMLYLSEYEGFGLPVLEAMSMGCPVIAANRASLPEVVRDSGILVDISNIDNIVTIINSVISDSELRNRLIASGLNHVNDFTWKKSANLLRELYKRICGPSGVFTKSVL